MTDDGLGRLYRDGMRDGTPAPRADDAASLDAMLRVIRGEAGEAERLRTLDRVMASSELREEFALLSAVAEGERRSAPLRRAWIPLAAAAAVLLVASGLVWQSRRVAVDDDVVRGEGASISLVAPRERLDAGRTFTWRSTGGESRYRFQLRDAEGGVLFDTVTRDTTLVLPTDVPVSPDREYRWWVRSERPDGSRAASALVSIRGSAMD
jgi:hypothetical protein